MPKGKLTVKSNDLKKFKLACEYAEVGIVQTAKYGVHSKVEVSYKSIDQIFLVGEIYETIEAPEVVGMEKKEEPKGGELPPKPIKS